MLTLGEDAKISQTNKKSELVQGVANLNHKQIKWHLQSTYSRVHLWIHQRLCYHPSTGHAERIMEPPTKQTTVCHSHRTNSSLLGKCFPVVLHYTGGFQ
jgi:hypothetical protein